MISFYHPPLGAGFVFAGASASVIGALVAAASFPLDSVLIILTLVAGGTSFLKIHQGQSPLLWLLLLTFSRKDRLLLISKNLVFQ